MNVLSGFIFLSFNTEKKTQPNRKRLFYCNWFCVSALDAMQFGCATTASCLFFCISLDLRSHLKVVWSNILFLVFTVMYVFATSTREIRKNLSKVWRKTNQNIEFPIDDRNWEENFKVLQCEIEVFRRRSFH